MNTGYTFLYDNTFKEWCASKLRQDHYLDCQLSFIAEHDLSDDDFRTHHWQTLFRIQYPQARP